MSLLQRARIHLQQARQEATHGVTANNAFIDLMVDEAYDLLLSAEEEVRRLREAAEDAWERMDRARNILTDDNPRPECNWGMLDTTLDRRKFEEGV